MLNKFLVGALALSLLAGIAHAAADQAVPPPPPPPQDQGAGNDGQGGWHGWWGHGHRHDMRGDRGGPGGPGMMGGRGDMMGGPGAPGGMMRGGNAFRLQLGHDVSVSIMCSTQAMKDCIAEAQPLIDAAKAAATVTPAK